MNGIPILYRSHLVNTEDSSPQAFFRFNQQMYTQKSDSTIELCSYGIHQNVVMLCICMSSSKCVKAMPNVDEYIYGSNDQIKLRKQYNKFISPGKYDIQQQLIKENHKIRLRTKRFADYGPIDQPKKHTSIIN